MQYMVNGEEVEYIDISKSSDKVNVIFHKKYNIVTTSVKKTMKKLREKGIEATICKNIYERYVCLFLEDIDEYLGVLHILNVPLKSCKIDMDNNIVFILLDLLEGFNDKSYDEILSDLEY